MKNEEIFLEKGRDELVPLRYEVETEKSPTEAYALIREYDDTGYAFLLESADTEDQSIKKVDSSQPLNDRGKYSAIGYNPRAVVEIGSNKASIEDLEVDTDLDFSESVLDGRIRNGYDQIDVLRDVMPDVEVLNGDENRPNLTGGLVGFHPYEIIYDIKPVESPREELDSSSMFVVSDRQLEYDHVEDNIELVFTPLGNEEMKPENQLEQLRDEAEEMEKILSEDVEIPNNIEVLSQNPGRKDNYEDSVRNVKEKILDGEIYQGVISRKNEMEIDGDPLSLYSELRENNPSPYMYILEFGDRGVLGASPEKLVSAHSRSGEDIIETNPIAGTRPRGTSPDADRALMGKMLADDKERAEHNMLVDLGRNDIRRVAEQGSVNVSNYMSVVQFRNVQHLESEVSAVMAEDKDQFDVMRSLIPAGTLTGAPKNRAMEIIASEEEKPRGIYGGAVGYYSFNGDLNSAIAIRSMDFEVNENSIDASLQAGAGIVQDSEPSREFDETQDKMRSLLQVVEELEGDIQ